MRISKSHSRVTLSIFRTWCSAWIETRSRVVSLDRFLTAMFSLVSQLEREILVEKKKVEIRANRTMRCHFLPPVFPAYISYRSCFRQLLPGIYLFIFHGSCYKTNSLDKAKFLLRHQSFTVCLHYVDHIYSNARNKIFTIDAIFFVFLRSFLFFFTWIL